MADVFTLVVAVAELSTLTGRFLREAQRLRTQIKELPEYLQQVTNFVKEFEDLHKSLNANIEASDGLSDVIPANSVTHIKHLLASGRSELKALKDLLSQLKPIADLPRSKRIKLTFEGVRHEDDILRHVKRLEEFRSHIAFWANDQLLVLVWKSL